MTCAGASGREKPQAHLEGWRLIRADLSHHLVGIVFGHVRIPDMHLIVTSDVVDVRMLSDGRVIVETVNTFYALGEPACTLSEEYGAILDEILGEDWRPAPANRN